VDRLAVVLAETPDRVDERSKVQLLLVRSSVVSDQGKVHRHASLLRTPDDHLGCGRKTDRVHGESIGRIGSSPYLR